MILPYSNFGWKMADRSKRRRLPRYTLVFFKFDNSFMVFETRKVAEFTDTIENGTKFLMKLSENEFEGEIWATGPDRLQLEYMGERQTAALSADENDKENYPPPSTPPLPHPREVSTIVPTLCTTHCTIQYYTLEM